MRNLFLIALIASASTASAKAYTGVSAGYFMNKDFKGPMAGFHVGYQFAPLTEQVSHALELEVLGGELKAHKQDTLVRNNFKASRKNEVKALHVPLLLNYRLGVALDEAKQWKLELGIGGGAQYLQFKGTETLSVTDLEEKQVMDPNKPLDSLVWNKFFKTTEPVSTTKKKSWQPVGSLTLGISCQASEQLSFSVRARALISPKRHVWAGKYPVKTGTEVPLMPATVKWSPVQYGLEAVVNYNF
jgi:hypothetical protein